MYQAIILENDEREALAVRDRIGNSPFAGRLSVSTVANVCQLAALIEKEGLPNILFADIVLEEKGMNGIEVVRHLIPTGSGVQVIYITGYAEYCVPVYETEHVYFLLKPVDQETFDRALWRAVEKLQEHERRLLPITFKGETTLLPFDQILFVESRLRKVIFHTASGEHEMYATLGDVLEQLPPSFTRAHKSFLVNMDAIVKLGSTSVELRSGDTVPVGQRFSGPLKRSFATYLA